MNVDIELIEGPLGPSAPWRPAGAGAVVTFEGVVRPSEAGRPLEALDYEAYEPMTTRELRRMSEDVCEVHGLVGMRVAHSVGRVPVHRCSFRLEVAGAHRKEALSAMDAFIDRLKRTVPLWKVPVWADGDAAEVAR